MVELGRERASGLWSLVFWVFGLEQEVQEVQEVQVSPKKDAVLLVTSSLPAVTTRAAKATRQKTTHSSDTEMTSENYLIGPLGGGHIREELSQRDPLQVIQQMQRDHGLRLPRVNAIYPLLDHHHRLRREVHAACLDALKSELVGKIAKDNELGEESRDKEKFDRLLAQTLPYIAISQLRDIPMALMRRNPNRPSDEVLEQLKQNPAVFQACPIEIRRRVWKNDATLFEGEIVEMLLKYHNDEKLQELEMDMRPQNVIELIRSRRQNSILRDLLTVIGDDLELYQMFVHVVKIVFEIDPHPSLATIRFDILMALHETDVKKITESDQTHMLVWSLDACVRNQTLDDFRITKIRECFDGLKRDMPLYVDFAMVLMDPTTANLFSSFMLKLIRASVEQGQEMNTDDIDWAARMINLGASAHRIHVSHQYRAPKLDRALRDEFWSTMAGFVVDEQTDAAGSSDLSRDMEDPEIKIVEELCSRSEVARKLFLQYTLDRALIPDVPALTRCLPRILNTLPSPPTPEQPSNGDFVLHNFTYHSFLHSFLAALARSHLPRLISNPRFKKVVVDEFLIPLVERWDESAHEIVAKFLSEFFDVRVIGGQVGGVQVVGVGEAVSIVEEWADRVFIAGKKDEERLPNLHQIYESLIKRSRNYESKRARATEDENQKSDKGRYAINPPSVLLFLEQFGVSGTSVGDVRMEDEEMEQEDVVMAS